MSRYIAFVLAAFCLALPASAAEKFDADACALAVAPYLDGRAFAVLHVDLTALDVDALAAKVAAAAKTEPDALPLPRKEAAAALKSLTDAGGRDLYLVASLADVPERPPFVVLPLEKGADAAKLAAALGQSHPFGLSHFERVGDAVVGGDEATVRRLHDPKPAAFPELADAFAAAGGTAQLAVVPPKDSGKIIESIMPTLPAEVGGGSSRALTQGFRWAAVGLDASKPQLNLTIQAADADSAKALLGLLQKTYAAAGKSKGVREALPNFDKLVELLSPKVADDRLTLTLDEPALGAALRPLVPKAAEASERTRFSNQLKQLALAAFGYMDDHGAFPAAYTADNAGKPLLSWRVHLLPYLGEEKLYKEFHLDEPWDSDHNKKLIEKMPAVFRSTADPKLAEEGKTTFLAPIGDATMFPGPKGVRIAEVTDGTSDTILFVQADDDRAVVWTKPDDLAYDPKEPMKGLGGRFPDGFLTAFADSSAHFIPKSIDKDMLRALFTRNGGEVVNVP